VEYITTSQPDPSCPPGDNCRPIKRIDKKFFSLEYALAGKKAGINSTLRRNGLSYGCEEEPPPYLPLKKPGGGKL